MWLGKRREWGLERVPEPRSTTGVEPFETEVARPGHACASPLVWAAGERKCSICANGAACVLACYAHRTVPSPTFLLVHKSKKIYNIQLCCESSMLIWFIFKFDHSFHSLFLYPKFGQYVMFSESFMLMYRSYALFSLALGSKYFFCLKSDFGSGRTGTLVQ